MLTFIAPLLVLQAPPHTPPQDKRYGWGNSNRATVLVNGKPIAEGALIRDNRVQVPMRPIFEALGAYLEWFPENRKVVAHKGDRVVSLVLNENFAYNPRPITLDYPPRMIRGRVYVPLRFVAQTLGATVSFDRKAKIARVDVPRKEVE